MVSCHWVAVMLKYTTDVVPIFRLALQDVKQTSREQVQSVRKAKLNLDLIL
jgi:hypothetical protein